MDAFGHHSPGATYSKKHLIVPPLKKGEVLLMKKTLLLAVVLCTFGVQLGFAQSQSVPERIEAYSLVSGPKKQIQRTAGPVFSETVVIKDAPWMRLLFTEANLGAGSYLQLTSLKDGATQRLNAKTLAQWGNTSAYFNGNAVRVELFAAPGDQNIFVSMNELVVGEYASDADPETKSVCGISDDRTSSNNPAVGRIINVGCTGWIVSNGIHVTAGHCVKDLSKVNLLEFNVPASLPDGTIQFASPDDQYAINTSSIKSRNNGPGDDWATFDVFNNPNTNLQPIAAQGASFNVVQDLGPTNIRITGYGVDSGADNQTQQTHVGPNDGSSGTILRYETDTKGGNSGSPVIDTATGNAIGVHDAGGCFLIFGSNKGTSTYNKEFWTALGMSNSQPYVSTAYVLDRSGSMAGTPLKGAKESANKGISLMAMGEEVSVVSFNGSASTNLGLTFINDNTQRNAAYAAVNSLGAGGSTSIGAGLLEACNLLSNSTAPALNAVLLSDGFHNTAPSPADGRACIQALGGTVTTPPFKKESDSASGGRIHAIAFGTGADQVLLASLAASTGGLFLFVPETNDPLALADLFLTIQGEIDGDQRFGSFAGTLSAPQEEVISFSIGSDTFKEEVTLIWDDLNADLDLSLEKPDGTVIDRTNWESMSSVSRVEGPGIEYFTLNVPEPGEWKARIVATSGAAEYALVLSGLSDIQMEVFFDKNEYAPGAPILLSAALSEDVSVPESVLGPVTGATVTAEVVTPTTAGVTFMAMQKASSIEDALPGILRTADKQYIAEGGTVLFTTETITLFDDGLHGDGEAGDGVYANRYTNTQNEGTYSFTVTAEGTSPAGNGFLRESSVATVVTATALQQYALAVTATIPAGVAVSPADANGESDGSTPFDRLYDEGAVVTLTAEAAAANGFVFEKWVIDDTLMVETPSVELTITADRSAEAVYLPALPHAYVLLADNMVYLNGQSASDGLVHSNGRILFDNGLPSVHTGDVSAVRAIQVGAYQTVDGDVTSGRAVRVNPNGGVTGTISEGASVDEVSPPALSFRGGNTNIGVAPNTSLDLAPGYYGHVRVGNQATLNLVEGEYFFHRLSVGENGTINAKVDDNTTTVNVVRDARFATASTVNVFSNGDAGSRFLTINSLLGDISVGSGSEVSGSLIAPAGTVYIGEKVSYRGAICAKNIQIEQGAVVYHHTSTRSSTLAMELVSSPDRSEATRSDKAVPSEISLEANYPNPFNPTTTIRFTLPQTEHVRLSVYDMLGREVALLIDSSIGAGQHSVVFDASHLSNGTYLYRLVAGGESFTGRMLLLK